MDEFCYQHAGKAKASNCFDCMRPICVACVKLHGSHDYCPECSAAGNGAMGSWAMSNRRHKRSGHLFQGRYKAILVDRDSYFLELARYIVLNPVRAAMVKHPRLWAWSSYGTTRGTSPAPVWLTTDGLFAAEFGKRRAGARRKYQQFIEEGMSAESIWKDLKGQIYLGDDDFVEQMRSKLGERDEDVATYQRVQQRGPAHKAQRHTSATQESGRRDSGSVRDRGLQLSTNREGIWSSLHHSGANCAPANEACERNRVTT